jgi:hypothetical protein
MEAQRNVRGRRATQNSARHDDALSALLRWIAQNEGRGITGGFAYHGRIAALSGKYVFGDIHGGRIFAADLAALKKADDGIPRTVAPIEEVQLYEREAGGKRVNVSLQELIDRKMGSKITRADLFISQTRDGELLVTSRQDGTIRMLVPDSAGEN